MTQEELTAIETRIENLKEARWESVVSLASTIARDDAPALLSEIRRLRDEVDGLERAYDLKAIVHDTLLRDYMALRRKNTRLRAELEAAKRDIKKVLTEPMMRDMCDVCKKDDGLRSCWSCDDAEWRGLCAENGGKENG